MPARNPTLTLRELNRALLARQLLLKRARIGAVDAVERLGCLQGQWAPSPYVALWSRLAGFERDRLTGPIDRGELVKATLMRATLHIVSAREYPAYSLATMDGRFGAWRPWGGPALADLEKVHRSVMTFAAKTPRTRVAIADYIKSHVPPSAAKDERLRNWFLWASVAISGLIWEPAGAHFEYRQLARHVAPPAKLRKHPSPIWHMTWWCAGTSVRSVRPRSRISRRGAAFASLTSAPPWRASRMFGSSPTTADASFSTLRAPRGRSPTPTLLRASLRGSTRRSSATPPPNGFASCQSPTASS